MINIGLATAEDIHEAYANRKACFGPDSLEGMLNCLHRGCVYVLSDEHGNIGCVIGFVLIWSGVASCGAITTDLLYRSPIGYTRAVRRTIEAGMIQFHAHRAEITVEAGFMEAHKWARTLGFMAEGTLEKYGPDKKDHVIYGRVTE